MLVAIHIIIASILANIVAQTLKWMIPQRVGKRSLLGDGGMPSAHSSTATALVFMIFLLEGLTTAFAVAFMLACIIIYDALNIRREVGRHARYLNTTAKKKFKEDTGHDGWEVLAGVFTGAVVACVYAFFL